jgi:hypothetical protein
MSSKLSKAQGITALDEEVRHLDRDEDREDSASRRNRVGIFHDAHSRGEVDETSEAAVDGTGQVNDASAPPTRRYADRSASRDEKQAEPERKGLLSLSAMDS